MQIIEKKRIKVVCEFNSNHVIEKIINIKSEDNDTNDTIANVYCPFCNKWTNGYVKGEMTQDECILRELETLINLHDLRSQQSMKVVNYL